MPEEHMPALQQAAPSFQFAFKGPGLSVSVSSENISVIAAYANLTLFGGAPQEIPAGTVAGDNAVASQQATSAPQAEAPKQTRSRAKDKDAAAPGPVAVPDPPATTTAAPLATSTTVSKDDLAQRTVEVYGVAEGKPAITTLLGKFGCTRFRDLPEDKYADYSAGLAIIRQELVAAGKLGA